MTDNQLWTHVGLSNPARDESTQTVSLGLSGINVRRGGAGPNVPVRDISAGSAARLQHLI